MDKTIVLQLIIEELQKQLELTREASLDAADYATNEESKADSKWDTQGLEASYLAAGQAAQALEIADSIQVFRLLENKELNSQNLIASGSLIELDVGGNRNWYFLSKAAGGLTVNCEGNHVTVVTTQSPLGRNLPGKQQGDSVSLPNGLRASVSCVL
jgi:hypothetical protein